MTGSVVSAATQAAARAPARRPPRELAAATVGSIVESYDWTVYGILAVYFSDQMFPGSSPAARLLAAYLGFAVGFLVRPIGSLVVGRIADTYGRRTGLTVSVAVVAAGSLVLAVTPTYEAVGIVAPVAVVLARLAQGLSVGGENPSAAAYVTETAPARRRYLYSAVSYGGVVVGSALSFAVLSVLLAVLGEAGVRDGGWRIAFVVGAALGLVAVWIRWGVAETEVFTRQVAARPARPAVLPLLRAHLKPMAVIFAVTVGATTVFYFCTVYLPVYADEVGAASAEESSGALLVGLAALMVSMLVAGLVADRTRALPVLRTGFAGLAVLVVPLLAGLAAGLLPVALVVVVMLGLLGLPLAVSNVFSGGLFAPAVRVVAVGLPAALAISLFGGTFPAIAELLRADGHISWIPWWIAGLAALALAASYGVRERSATFTEQLPERMRDVGNS